MACNANRDMKGSQGDVIHEGIRDNMMTGLCEMLHNTASEGHHKASIMTARCRPGLPGVGTRSHQLA